MAWSSAGALEGVDAIFGQHVWPFLPSGTLGSRAGALMGACQQFQVTIRGRGGHAAMPHTVIDPIVASSHVILALQVPPDNSRLSLLQHKCWDARAIVLYAISGSPSPRHTFDLFSQQIVSPGHVLTAPQS